MTLHLNQVNQLTSEHQYRLLHFGLQVSLDAGMKLLMCVCDTKHVEKVHRSLSFTVCEIMILSVTISYAKREWISFVNIPTVHTQQREPTVHTMSWEQQSAILAEVAGSLAHHQGQHVKYRNYITYYITFILKTVAFKLAALLYSITAHYYVAKLYSITAHYYVAKLHSITAHYYVPKLHSITAHYYVAKLYSITAHYYVAKLYSITAHLYVAKFLCRISQYIQFIPQCVILCPDYDA